MAALPQAHGALPSHRANRACMAETVYEVASAIRYACDALASQIADVFSVASYILLLHGFPMRGGPRR
jgi:NTP pyrophosphatase (non-canonical NTP hydrolase)